MTEIVLAVWTHNARDKMPDFFQSFRLSTMALQYLMHAAVDITRNSNCMCVQFIASWITCIEIVHVHCGHQKAGDLINIHL